MRSISVVSDARQSGDGADRSNDDLRDCDVVPVGKRRDGGTRYWCLVHRADATAKYGEPLRLCRAAHIAPVSQDETLILNLDEFPGGVALWGAVPPVYDTTRLPLSRGIHVHARKSKTGPKDIDQTVRAVQLLGGGISEDGFYLSELDAIYYMVSSVFGFQMRHIVCSYCGYSHLDKDWFSVHIHRRHLCAGCGKYFKDSADGIGNPIRQLQSKCNINLKNPRKSAKTLRIKQSEFPGGIQIWGSNSAFLWSSDRAEEEGIHVHTYKADNGDRFHDGTCSEVIIDEVRLDPVMVRTLMAQRALPHIEGRIMSLTCVRCSASEFSSGEEAFTPKAKRVCSKCGGKLHGSGNLHKVIGNPLIRMLDSLAQNAPRLPQQHVSGLLAEAPSNLL